jgi:hypothetical protein
VKTIADAAIAALDNGTAVVSAAVEILSVPPILVWGGYGKLHLDGKVFDPLGDRGLAESTGAAIGATDQGMTLSLSGVEPEALELLDADEVRDAPTVIWELIFSGDGKTLLDAYVVKRGRVDDLVSDDAIGGEALIKATVEGAARGLGRRGGRMRTDADQRMIKANDGFFRNVSFAGEKQLHWGGQRPATAASALGGAAAGGGGGFHQEQLQQF